MSSGQNSFVAGAYFLIFVTVGGFILIKLFAGVIIDKFNQLQDERSGMAFMSFEEKEWVETRKVMQRIKPLAREQPPTNELRARAYRIAVHTYFEYLVMFMIVLNVVFMAITVYEEPSPGVRFPTEPPRDGTDYIELLFTFFFICEAALKLTAFFPLKYFSVGWNIFDFILCVVSIFDFITSWVLTSGTTELPFDVMLLRLLRMARIARLVRLVRSAKGLRTLLGTISETTPALLNVCSLLLLLFLVFATMGMGFFGEVLPRQHQHPHPHQHQHQHPHPHPHQHPHPHPHQHSPSPSPYPSPLTSHLSPSPSPSPSPRSSRSRTMATGASGPPSTLLAARVRGCGL